MHMDVWPPPWSIYREYDLTSYVGLWIRRKMCCLWRHACNNYFSPKNTTVMLTWLEWVHYWCTGRLLKIKENWDLTPKLYQQNRSGQDYKKLPLRDRKFQRTVSLVDHWFVYKFCVNLVCQTKERLVHLDISRQVLLKVWSLNWCPYVNHLLWAHDEISIKTKSKQLETVIAIWQE